MNKAVVAFIGVIILGAFVLYEASLTPDREILIDSGSDNAAALDNQVTQNTSDELTPAMPVIISDDRVQHILYGDDDNGGGHKYGVGKPCKSEFPPDWNDEKIIQVVRRIATNDNLPWEQQDNQYFVAEDYEGNIRVRVVKGPQRQRVITAYPTNVNRNPCRANDR